MAVTFAGDLPRRQVAFDGRVDDARTQRFGEHQPIAHMNPLFGKNPVGVDETGHGKPVFQLFILHAVSTQQAPHPLL
jgi:hypothetical protein